MKRDNRGFSLVELILAMAILVIVAGIVGGFMVSGARAYASVSTGIKLQTQTQMALNQIREYAVDCNSKLEYEDEKKLIIDETHTFLLNADKELIYTVKGDVDGSGKLTEYKVATGVKKFEITPQKITKGEITYITSFTCTITMEKNGKTHTEKLSVALRNKPIYEEFITEP